MKKEDKKETKLEIIEESILEVKESTNSDSLGWLYNTDVPEGDARKLVTLKLDGMEWVGIRIWIAGEQAWFNGNEREQAWVIAWQDLPATARRHWEHGKLTPEFPESKYKNLVLKPKND